MAGLTADEKGVNARFIAVYDDLRAARIVRSKSEFCESLAMPREYFSKIEGYKLALPEYAVNNLKNKYFVQPVWLKYGEGEMYATLTTEPSNTNSGNRVSGSISAIGNNSSAGGSDLAAENEKLRAELESLKRLLAAKEEIIDLLKQNNIRPTT